MSDKIRNLQRLLKDSDRAEKGRVTASRPKPAPTSGQPGSKNPKGSGSNSDSKKD